MTRRIHNWALQAACVVSCILTTLAAPALGNVVCAQGQPADRGVAAAVPGEVLVILASETEGPVDPSLGSIKALKQPPFNGFKTMKVLSRSAVALSTGKPAEVELPNGRHLQLEFLARMPDGRYKVQVSINRPNQKDYLPLLQVVASSGEPFFVAGQKFQGGTLVIGVQVGVASKSK
ncbi:MAG TPA: hypothetical protein VF331_10350 [Polyangiales bacterium]